jgi:hypothetical protein
MRTASTAALLLISHFGIGHAQQATDEVLVGPIDYEQDVESVPVTLTAMSYFKIKTEANQINVRARIVGDLGDLQKKIGSIVDKFGLPRDNCRSYSANNPVVSIPRKELLYRNGEAIFSIGGTVAVWDCRENPVPNSKVEWQIKDVGFGIKTKVPVIKTWPGNPIKNRLGSQSFDADLPLSIVKKDDSTLELQLGRPDINLKGQYAFITKGILSIAGININDKAMDALRKAIDPEKLRVSLPEDFLKFNPAIESARFLNVGGNLAIEISMSAFVPGSLATEFLRTLLEKKS